METPEKDLSQQIERLASALHVAEQYAKQVLQTARAKRRSFGLAYNYLDEDIAQVRGRLRYMQLMARQWEVEEMRSRERPAAEQVTISSADMLPAKRGWRQALGEEGLERCVRKSGVTTRILS